MGTEYILHKGWDSEVSIGEMSSRLQLCIRDGEDFVFSQEMPPMDMLRLLMEGIKVTSYWMSEEEFNAVFSKLEVYPC